MSNTATLEKEEGSKKEIDAKTFLLLTQKGPKGSILDAKPLWGNYFRLNFWMTYNNPDCVMASNVIAESRFVKVVKEKNGYAVKDLTKNVT